MDNKLADIKYEMVNKHEKKESISMMWIDELPKHCNEECQIKVIKTPDKEGDQVNSGCETINVAKVNASNKKMKLLEYQKGIEDPPPPPPKKLYGINDKREE